MENFTLDKSLFTDKEQNEILFALQSLKATDIEVDLILSKLSTLFKKSNTNWLEVDFSRWGYRGIDTKRFNLLRQGILNKQVVEICYISGSGKETFRKINPVKLIFKQNNWYLQAYCQTANDFRTFKISRIKELLLSDDIFEEIPIEPPVIDNTEIKEKITHIENKQYEDGLVAVKLIFSPKIAYRVYDEFPPNDIKKEDNGYLTVTTKMPMDLWIYHYILSFGEQVDIIEPFCLKKEIKEYLKKMLKHFES